MCARKSREGCRLPSWWGSRVMRGRARRAAREPQDLRQGDGPGAQGQVGIGVAVVVVEMELADDRGQGVQPAGPVAAAEGIEVAHVQADLEIGGVHPANHFQEQLRLASRRRFPASP